MFNFVFWEKIRNVKSCFLGKNKKKYFKMLPAENFIQSAKML